VSRNARIALFASLLILTVLILATVMADPLVHPCPSEAQQCGRLCAGQPPARLPWRCTRATCQCPKPLPWPREFRTR
jgi:hypothetical protein